jgi:hypothetical protein
MRLKWKAEGGESLKADAKTSLAKLPLSSGR